MFLYFNIINLISIYNGEIEGMTAPYGYKLAYYTTGSMVNCIVCITSSIYLGKILDKYRCYKSMQIYLSLGCFLAILLTYLILEFQLYPEIGTIMTILAGAPISGIGVVAYQFAAEVSYPVSEV